MNCPVGRPTPQALPLLLKADLDRVRARVKNEAQTAIQTAATLHVRVLEEKQAIQQRLRTHARVLSAAPETAAAAVRNAGTGAIQARTQLVCLKGTSSGCKNKIYNT